jgi:hypothetical protein
VFCTEFKSERRNEMSQQVEATAPVTTQAPAAKGGWSIDAWAVLLAFVLAALVRAGVFKHIPW